MPSKPKPRVPNQTAFDFAARKAKARRKNRRPVEPESSEPEEPYEPREPSVIRAELRALAELYLAWDLEWWKVFRPEVFDATDQ